MPTLTETFTARVGCPVEVEGQRVSLSLADFERLIYRMEQTLKKVEDLMNDLDSAYFFTGGL